MISTVASLNLGYVYGLLHESTEAEKWYKYTAKLTIQHSRNPKQQLSAIISGLGYLGKLYMEQAQYKVRNLQRLVVISTLACVCYIISALGYLGKHYMEQAQYKVRNLQRSIIMSTVIL